MNDKLGGDELKIFAMKIDLMQLWCATFMENDHRCFLSYIFAKTMSQSAISFDDFKKFYRHSVVLQQLRDSLLIVINEKKIGKETKKQIMLNPQFFNKIISLIEAIKQKLKPDQQKIMNFNPKLEKFICKHCNSQKTKVQLKFMKDRCSCGKQEFQPVKEETAKKNRLDVINKTIDQVIEKRKKIIQAENQFAKQEKMLIFEREEKKESDLQKFMQQIRTQNSKMQVDNRLLQCDFIARLNAVDRFTPKKRFRIIQQMQKIGMARKRQKNN